MPSFHEKPTNLHNLFICLSRGNLRTNKPRVFTPKKFIVFFFTPHINASQCGMLLTGLSPKSYSRKVRTGEKVMSKSLRLVWKFFKCVKETMLATLDIIGVSHKKLIQAFHPNRFSDTTHIFRQQSTLFEWKYSYSVWWKKTQLNSFWLPW